MYSLSEIMPRNSFCNAVSMRTTGESGVNEKLGCVMVISSSPVDRVGDLKSSSKLLLRPWCTTRYTLPFGPLEMVMLRSSLFSTVLNVAGRPSILTAPV